MTLPSLLSSPLQVATCIMALTFTTSCGKKTQLQYEAAQARATMTELQAQVKKLDDEVKATGFLKRYNSTQPANVTELKGQIERMKADISSLKLEKEAAKSRVDALQKEIDSYRAKYRAS